MTIHYLLRNEWSHSEIITSGATIAPGTSLQNGSMNVWWRRGESNPCPEQNPPGPLRVQSVFKKFPFE